MDGTFVVALPGATVRVSDRAGTRLVEVRGEVDPSTGPAVRAVLTAQFDRLPAALVVDLTKTRFLTAAGVNALLEAARLADRRGVPFAVAADGRPVLRPLRITGADRAFATRPTVHQAFSAVRPALTG
ncbi:STAS domain-containing protein [Actinosynnema sp. NPDC020468]|uniref:STAS domain-containing protein n=1 Tax=Actinosynnema sp. NPDC020468 TaxID=3154488 RepID=UPI00340522C6